MVADLLMSSHQYNKYYYYPQVEKVSVQCGMVVEHSPLVLHCEVYCTQHWSIPQFDEDLNPVIVVCMTYRGCKLNPC